MSRIMRIQQRRCPICHTLIEGRANQDYCSNAHKAKAFRSRRQQAIKDIAQGTEPKFISHVPTHSMYSQVCEDLNWLYVLFSQAGLMLELEGSWEYAELKRRGKQEIKEYQKLLNSLSHWLATGHSSANFKQFMTPHQPKIARFYRLVIATFRTVLRSIPKSGQNGKVEVNLPPDCSKKLRQWHSFFRDLWLCYRDLHFSE